MAEVARLDFRNPVEFLRMQLRIWVLKLVFVTGQRLRPVQVLVQELDGAGGAHRVAALKEFDFGAVGEAELGVNQ